MNLHRFMPCLESLEVRALLNAGALDPTFAAGGSNFGPYAVVTTQLPGGASGQCAALQPDGKIVVAGNSLPVNGQQTQYGMVRYNADGTLDTSFGSNGTVQSPTGEAINAIAVAANGGIFASGIANNEAVVFAFNSNGAPKASFGSNGILILDSTPGSETAGLQLQSDGKIVGLLEQTSFEFLFLETVFRLNADGRTDGSFVAPSFPTNFREPYSLALTPNGQLVISGSSNNTNVTVFRLNPNGSQDTAFVGEAGTLQVSNAQAAQEVMVDAHNRILLLAAPGGGGHEQVLDRFNANGTPDVTFGCQGGADIGQVIVVPPSTDLNNFTDLTSILVQPDGRLVVAGTTGFSHSVLFISIDYLARYNPNGTPDTTFGTNGVAGISSPGANSSAAAAVLQPDGKIVVVGSASRPRLLFEDFPEMETARFLGDTLTGDTNQQFVSRLYLDLLQRPADPGGLASWSRLLDSGAATDHQIALGIESSQEYHNLVVNELYGEYLQRPAEAGGLEAWSAFLARGGTINELRAFLLGSAEYFADSGKTGSGFVAAVYRDVLGRSVDSSGAGTWQGALAAGASPLVVAVDILNSPEAISDEVTACYFWLLHRAPDSSGLQVFSYDLQQGLPVEGVVAAIVGSAEYRADAMVGA
jgi:uncharacterized delta-60 repeat protein